MKGKEREGILFGVQLKSKLCLSSCREENVDLFCIKEEKHDLCDMCAVDYLPLCLALFLCFYLSVSVCLSICCQSDLCVCDSGLDYTHL